MNRIRHLIARPPLALAAVLLASLSLVGETRGPTAEGVDTQVERLAVATLDPSPEAAVSAFAGHAPYFLLFEAGTGLVDAVTNDFAGQDRAAGSQAAYLLSELGVDCLVAGEAGPRMRTVLGAEGVDFVVAEGRAAEVAAELLALDPPSGF